MSLSRTITAGLIAAGLLASAAPAWAEDAPSSATAVHDPFESTNRGLFRFGQGLDRAVVRPVALGYKAVLPHPVRTGVRNVLNNIDEPNTAFNDLLQARPARFGSAVGRFAINSTIGLLGVFDVAGAAGLPKHNADFGETMGRWGVATGPYIYLPLIGPSDMRDGFGMIVDSFTGLLNIHDLHVTTAEHLGVTVVDGVDTRASLDSDIKALNSAATDPYVAVRSAYLQNRQSMVTDTNTAIQQLPSFDTPPPDTAPPATKP